VILKAHLIHSGFFPRTIYKMALFNAEVFDPGLLHMKNPSSRRIDISKRKEKGIVYRIFHLGDSTPTEGDEGAMLGHSKEPMIQSDSETSDDENASNLVVEKLPETKRKTIFNVGDEESSDYESDEEPKKGSSINIIKDFLSMSRKGKGKD
jgi:hypothetical protein